MKFNVIQRIIKFEVVRYLKSRTFLYCSLLFPIFVGFLFSVNADQHQPVSLIVQNNTEIAFSLDGCDNIIPIVTDSKMSVDEAFASNDNSQALLQLSFASNKKKLNATIYKKQKFPLEFYSTLREQIIKAYGDYLHEDSLSMMMNDAESSYSFEQKFYPENPNQTKGQSSAGQYADLTMAAIMLIYFIVFQFSNNIMKSISVEKQNKISEILLSSVHPKNIVFGKILSGYILALIQIVVWGVLIYLIINSFFDMSKLASLSLQSSNSNAVPLMSGNELLSFFLVFLMCVTGGYFMYSSLFAIIGSISNENTDTQKFSFILTMPLIITLVYVTQHFQSNNSVVIFLSYFPITSPIALMARMVSGISTWEILLSLLILFISMIVCVRLSSSLYRNTIIADKEKITIKELLVWLRQ